MSEKVTSPQSTAEVIFQQAFDSLEAGRFEEAAARFAAVIALVPGAAAPHIGRGDALQLMQRFESAVDSYDRAIALDGNVPEIYVNRGVALHSLGKFEAALASYDQAIALDLGYAEAWSNRGNALRKLHRHEDALQSYARAIALRPDDADAYINRAGAFEELDRTAEAITNFEKVLELAPNLLEAKQHLLWGYMQGGSDPERIARLAAEIAGEGGRTAAAVLRAHKTLSDFRIQHDREQAEYLANHGHGFAGLAEAQSAFADIQGRHGPQIAGKSVAISDKEADVLARFYEHVIRYPLTAFSGPCLNPANDWVAIEDRYFKSSPEIVVIDDLLSPEAMADLRTFCLASTIWRKDFQNQYFGTFSEDGFMSPLHLRIAAELRMTMPRIFGAHRLEQLWAFKYTSQMGRGINVHADFARVNLNFWITPDEANLDPQSGGMIVYDVPAPAAWGFEEYNSSSERIFAFLKENRAGSQTVAHKCNRAVLFNSNLFHETDTIRFKTGYENRRINVTYLFGKRFK